MYQPKDTQADQGKRSIFSIYSVMMLAFSLLALISTYFLLTSPLEVYDKTAIYLGIVGVYIAVFGIILFFRLKRRRKTDIEDVQPSIADVERGLGALDEATGHFSGTLGTVDAFRLISSRVGEFLPFQSIELLLLNESRKKLVSVYVDGERTQHDIGELIDFDDGLAGQAFSTKQVEIDGYMMLDSEQPFGSSVAIPLLNGDNVFGVIHLFFAEHYDLHILEPSIFEGVGNRVAPLIVGSMAYERSRANALTDVTTDLPNERAFYLVLENQVAEAQRDRGNRPLTILAIDIKNFQVINCTFGHVAGDKVLNFVARTIKENLRQMDFVARALNDEFLVILPTADKATSHEIIGRINAGFFGRRLAVNDSQAIEIELNVGWAGFGTDGETPGQLLSLAQLRKEHVKSAPPSNVIWFPQEQQTAVH